jgi:ABC-2 type transport system permease protein
MVNWKSKKLGAWLWLSNAIIIIVLINLLAGEYFFRIDLTEEHRYTIKDQTKEILSKLDDDVYVEVFLEGEMNPGFKRFQKSIIETLKEFEVYSNYKVHYTITNPMAANAKKAQSEFINDLARRGLQPANIIDNKDGQRVEKIVFPGVIISYGGFETGVMLLKGNNINHSIEGTEFELISAIHRLSNPERKKIGFVRGHGELDSLDIASFNNDLLEGYDVFRTSLRRGDQLNKYDVLIIAKPTSAYSALDQYNLDQYIMRGGNVMFLLDEVSASMDSASRDDYFALPNHFNLEDQLFKYGVRINPDLVQDQNAAFYPVVTGQVDGKPQFQLLNWPFFPLINHFPEHPITRNLDAVWLRFASSIDTVKSPGIIKKPLLITSAATRKLSAPVPVNVNDLRKMKEEDFSGGPIVVGYLLEGSFTSVYKNRFLPEGAETSKFIAEGKHARLVVIADGDIIRNEINPRSRQPQPLGFDPFTKYTFANRDLLLNSMSWLTEENGLIQTRSKEVMIRPLNREKIKEEKLKWQVINLVLPVLLIAMFGFARAFWRKRKYASF